MGLCSSARALSGGDLTRFKSSRPDQIKNPRQLNAGAGFFMLFCPSTAFAGHPNLNGFDTRLELVARGWRRGMVMRRAIQVPTSGFRRPISLPTTAAPDQLL